MISTDKVISDTERRYNERTAHREELEHKLREGNILAANSQEQVHARFMRLGIGERSPFGKKETSEETTAVVRGLAEGRKNSEGRLESE